jgi:protein TonB
MIAFRIDTTGVINKIKVLKSVHPLLDSEAVRVVNNMPAWRPGRTKEKK